MPVDDNFYKASKKQLIEFQGYFLQVGALIYRLKRGSLQYLLTTSARTKRWIIPKGWPMQKRTLLQAALIEAYEEAGIIAKGKEQPIGCFTYKKIRKETEKDCCIILFAAKFVKELRQWPEKKRRTRQWMDVEEAMQEVKEEALKEIMWEFSKKFKKMKPSEKA